MGRSTETKARTVGLPSNMERVVSPSMKHINGCTVTRSCCRLSGTRESKKSLTQELWKPNFLDACEFENPTSRFQSSTNGQRLRTWLFSGGSCVMGTKCSANPFQAHTEICPQTPSWQVIVKMCLCGVSMDISICGCHSFSFAIGEYPLQKCGTTSQSLSEALKDCCIQKKALCFK